jgi:hypothetical protein
MGRLRDPSILISFSQELSSWPPGSSHLNLHHRAESEGLSSEVGGGLPERSPRALILERVGGKRESAGPRGLHDTGYAAHRYPLVPSSTVRHSVLKRDWNAELDAMTLSWPLIALPSTRVFAHAET